MSRPEDVLCPRLGQAHAIWAAQADGYGGRHPGTTLTRPESTRCYPQKADAVDEEVHTPEGMFHAGMAVLLARASNQVIQVFPRPPPLVVCRMVPKFIK